MIRRYYVYMLASECNRILYIGMTNDLHRRISEHKTHLNKGFTEEHYVKKLVYYEMFYYINDAIAREKQVKKWKRSWKNVLINTINPSWFDLSDDPRLPASREIFPP
ncbi:MAG: GIY-YIG nuclease family protein [Bacteroidia bacterium]|nr:GIY-YIG nuclease family protein [Bacteroidia bacterium]